MEHTNAIYLCSHEEWQEFLDSKQDDYIYAENITGAAFGKWVNKDNSKRVHHTWYGKVYGTKFNQRRPSLLYVGKGFEFEVEIINRLVMAIHPRDGEIQYGTA